MDPNNPDVLYAGLWEVYRTPHSLSSGGAGSGLFKTTDGGATWTELTRNPGLPGGIWGKLGVAVSPADGSRVYAIVENQNGGVFASDDAGATWRSVNTERRLRQRAFYYTRIYADPKEKDTVYVLNTGFYRSTDGGKTYRAVRVPHGDNHDLWIAPNDPKRMINSNDGGANVSVNGGESWTDQDYPTSQFYSAFVTAHVPYQVCGSQQDNSTACVPSTGTGNEYYEVGGGESGYIAPDPLNPDIFYAGSYGGHLTRYDHKTNQARAINVWPDNPMGYSAKDITERFQWTYPVVISPADSKTLYVGSQHVWSTTNGGQSWTRISPDLTRHDPSTLGPSGGPITLDQTGVETYATVFSIAPSRLDANLIWTGSDDGLVFVTQDGKSWSEVTPRDLPEFARISLVEASPHKPGTAFIAANRYQRNDRAPYVYRTDDFGKSWTKIVGGLPADDFARCIREDVRKAGLLYLGTETGIYVSFNNGRSWQSLRLDLPVTPVHGIVSMDTDLVVATHGRSFYILDNAAILREFTPELPNANVHLFTPPQAMRSVGRGVIVDYLLRTAAPKVTIDILDSQGQVVNSFSGEPPKEGQPAEAAPPSDEESQRRAMPRVSTRAGMNRFTWDMRYPNAKDFPGLIMWAGSTRGPLAPPGRYQVRLTSGTDTQTKPFAIVRNPNIPGVTDLDLQEQFKLAQQISQRVNQANEAVIRIRDLKKQLADRLAALTAAEKGQSASITRLNTGAFIDKLTIVEGEIYQYRNQSSQDPLNYPIKLNNKLAALQGVVESGDGRPTEQSFTVFKELGDRLTEQITRLDAIVKTDITALNKELVKKKLEAVK